VSHDPVAGQRGALLEWLERRAPTAVETVETHISIVAFQGDRAFKLKKAVAFAFVDLSTAGRPDPARYFLDRYRNDVTLDSGPGSMSARTCEHCGRCAPVLADDHGFSRQG
jgi:aminoglycoside phosphotransferase family enzyme